MMTSTYNIFRCGHFGTIKHLPSPMLTTATDNINVGGGRRKCVIWEEVCHLGGVSFWEEVGGSVLFGRRWEEAYCLGGGGRRKRVGWEEEACSLEGSVLFEGLSPLT